MLMSDDLSDADKDRHEYLKNSILDEVQRTLDDRACRLAQVDKLGIVPCGVFGAPSAECIELFRDGHYYGCISLVQSVTEAIVRHVWQVKLCKKKAAAGEFDSNLASLHKKGLISDEVKTTMSTIWADRNTFHHLALSLSKEVRDLEQLAAEKLRLLGDVEKHFFGYDIERGTLKPHKPELWDIQPDGNTLVYVRGGL